MSQTMVTFYPPPKKKPLLRKHRTGSFTVITRWMTNFLAHMNTRMFGSSFVATRLPCLEGIHFSVYYVAINNKVQLCSVGSLFGFPLFPVWQQPAADGVGVISACCHEPGSGLPHHRPPIHPCQSYSH